MYNVVHIPIHIYIFVYICIWVYAYLSIFSAKKEIGPIKESYRPYPLIISVNTPICREWLYKYWKESARCGEGIEENISLFSLPAHRKPPWKFSQRRAVRWMYHLLFSPLSWLKAVSFFMQPFSGVQYTAGIEHSDMEFFVILNPNINVTPFKTLSKYLKGSEERKGDGYTFRNLNHTFEVKDKANRLPGSCHTSWGQR